MAQLFRQGDLGDQIVELQHMLHTYGYRCEITGEFDLQMVAWVLAFQQDNGLYPDGIVGPRTQQLLINTINYSGPGAMPASSAESRMPSGVGTSENPADVFTLPVPYLTQRDNRIKPAGRCNVTCAAMVATFFGWPAVLHSAAITKNDRVNTALGELAKRIPGSTNTPRKRRGEYFQLEDVLSWIMDNDYQADEAREKLAPWASKAIGNHNIHAMLAWLLTELGIPAKAKAMQYGEILQTISGKLEGNGVPLIISGQFTLSGHLVVGMGHINDHDLIVNDPWGDWMRKYRGSGAAVGAQRVYPYEPLQEVLYRGSSIRCIVPTKVTNVHEPQVGEVV